MQSAVVGPAFTARHAGTVIAVVKNNCVLGKTGIGDLLEIGARTGVHHGKAIIILCPVLAHLRCVRMISGNAHLLGIMDAIFRIDVVANLTLVTDRVIENGKERLAFRTVLPVRATAAGIPDLPRLLEVVILLRIVRTIIPRLAQVLRVHLEASR